jgi:hypothetical protein
LFAASDLGVGAVILALSAGAMGAVFTAVVAYGARLSRIKSEVLDNDHAIDLLDRHLETWVTDETIRLMRELSAITASMNADPDTGEARNPHWSGHHATQIAAAKEAALHRYRDQETTALSHADGIAASEGWPHAVVRRWQLPSRRPELSAPARLRPILDRWAAPVTRHLSYPGSGEAVPVDDPRGRTIESTLEMLDADPKALV